MLADEPRLGLEAAAAEFRGLVHRVVYVEPTVMLTGEKRQTRYAGMHGDDRKWLAKAFEGVNVVLVGSSGEAGSAGIIRSDYEHSMRAVAVPVWKAEGMQPNDIGVLADSDELFSRSFLKALVSCDVPQFRPSENCKRPKVQCSVATLGCPFVYFMSMSSAVYHNKSTLNTFARCILERTGRSEHSDVSRLDELHLGNPKMVSPRCNHWEMYRRDRD